MGRIGMYLITIGTIAAAAVAGFVAEAKAYFELDYPPTPQSIHFYSPDPNSPDLDPNNEVGVFVDANDPNIGKICIGKYVVTNPNKYGPLHVYGDDLTTGIKDGAYSYDPLEFRIWDDSEMKEYFAETDPCDVLYDPANEGLFTRVDLSKGNRVPYDWWDLADFASWWLASDCSESNNHCGWWDSDLDGDIDFNKDYADFADNWGGGE